MPWPLSLAPGRYEPGSRAFAPIHLLLLALACGALGACAEVLPKPSIATALNPLAAAPNNHWKDWHPSGELAANAPDLRSRPKGPDGNALVDQAKTYALSDLVDLALRANPVTRGAWEEARAAAAGLGIAEATWLPVINASMHAGYWQYPFPESTGAFSLRGTAVDPVVGLSWTLFDRARPAKIDQATQKLFSANRALNRTHQKVAFEVQNAFFACLAARAQVAAAEMTLRQTGANVESVQAQLDRGLATRPELLLTVQDQARAGYELQAAKGEVMDKEAQLAESLGITPNVPLRTVGLSDVPLPKEIEVSADEIIDSALAQRPDLSAKLAELRVRDAEIRQAEAAYWPTIGLVGHGGWKQWDYTQARGGGPSPEVRIGSPLADAFVTFEWNLFEGFALQNAVGAASARRNAAEAELESLQLRIIRDVWKAYADVKTAIRKREFAVAMLTAAEQSFEAARETYGQGLATVIELLTAERSLASARYTEVDSKAKLLQSAASLVYSAGGSADARMPAADSR
jgi:outer membrane protein